MEKIIILPELAYKLTDLINRLYKDEYFGFMDSARDYVSIIFDFIYTIPDQHRKRTKNPALGFWYCKYKHNHNTTWYITFDLEDDIFLIKDITNNHTEEYLEII